jgi:hypothetical protein
MKINKKILNPAIFFTLLYWLLFYLLVIKNKLFFKVLSLKIVLLLFALNVVIILLSRWLYPLFALVTKLAQRIGNLLFALISAVVFYLILFPISMIKKIMGNKLMETEFDKKKLSYFEDWDPPGDIKKQY